MNKEHIRVAAIALLVGIAGGYVIAQAGTQKGDTDEAVQEGGEVDPHAEHMRAMMGGTVDDGGMAAHMDHMMAMMVTSERAFIEGMIPHHQEAVDTAREVIERGATTPAIEALVQDIVVAQEKEIADMKAWYEAWYGEPYVDTGTYMPMMRELRDLSGAELDRAFLEDMIGHHMGAIMMAQSVQPYIEHDEVATLTEAIVRTQSKEIADMRVMLRGL